MAIRAIVKELNDKLNEVYEADNPFVIDVAGRPNIWLDARGGIHKFNWRFRAPLVAGELAVMGFVGSVQSADRFVPYAVGELEESTLPNLGFRIVDAAILNAAVKHVGLKYDFER